jgi:hypothetical protein
LQWLDGWLKLLVPVVLVVLLAAAYKFGSFQAYLQLFSSRSYASFLPALGAAYALLMLLFQVIRTVLWASSGLTRWLRPLPGDRDHSRLIMKGPWWRRPSVGGGRGLPCGPPGNHLRYDTHR